MCGDEFLFREAKGYCEDFGLETCDIVWRGAGMIGWVGDRGYYAKLGMPAKSVDADRYDRMDERSS